MVYHNKPQTGLMNIDTWHGLLKQKPEIFFKFIYIMEFFCLKLSNDFHYIWSKSPIPAAHEALQNLVPASYPFNLIA